MNKSKRVSSLCFVDLLIDLTLHSHHYRHLDMCVNHILGLLGGEGQEGWLPPALVTLTYC